LDFYLIRTPCIISFANTIISGNTAC